jgi:outer membrane protein OmpA-like peptidoglycan-associated protein
MFIPRQDISNQLFTTLFILFINFYASAQLVYKSALNNYKRQEYYICAPKFEKIADKYRSDSKKHKTYTESLKYAALSYYKLFEMEKSVSFFKKIDQLNLLSHYDLKIYIKALKYLQDSVELNTIKTKLLTVGLNNNEFKSLIKFFEKPHIANQFQYGFTISSCHWNSGKGEIAICPAANFPIITTRKLKTKLVNPIFAYDNNFYYSLSQLDSNANELKAFNLSEIKLNNNGHIGPIDFAESNNTFVLTQNNETNELKDNISKLGIYFLELKNEEFNRIQAYTYNSNNYNIGNAIFGKNDTIIYFASDMPGGYGGIDLYYSSFNGKNWSTPVNMGSAINTTENENFPFWFDGLFYFASDGHPGFGGLDIFCHDFKNQIVYNLGRPINSNWDDFSISFKKNNEEGFFCSNRNDRIDQFFNFEKLNIEINLNGSIDFDKNKNQSVFIELYNVTSKSRTKLFLEHNNEFNCQLVANQDYFLYSDLPNTDTLHFSTFGIHNDTTITKLLEEKKTPTITFQFVDAKNQKLLSDVIVEKKSNYEDLRIIGKSAIDGKIDFTNTNETNSKYYFSKIGYLNNSFELYTAENETNIVVEMTPISTGAKFILEDIYFDLDSFSLRPDSKLILDNLSNFIITNEIAVELSAHTDSRGSSDYNMNLSKLRAESCVKYLISIGVNPDLIFAKGYGETQLTNLCSDGVFCSENEHQKNRRTEIKILSVSKN